MADRDILGRILRRVVNGLAGEIAETTLSEGGPVVGALQLGRTNQASHEGLETARRTRPLIDVADGEAL